MGQMGDYIKRFGILGMLRFALYPITTLITTPVQLLRSLLNCLVLFKGRWGDYPHFNAATGLNTLFYWTRAMNLKRFGRKGKSPYLGLGDFNLARCFHYSLISLFAFWKASTVLILVSLFLWLGSFAAWFDPRAGEWLPWVIMAMALGSTTFYVNAFRSQNYNAFGWIFFPTFLLGLMTENFYLAAGALFLASFGSFTSVFIGGIMATAGAVWNLDIWYFLAALPAAFKLLLHFYPFLTTGDSKRVIGSVMKAIGMSRGKARYKRQQKGKRLDLVNLYHLALMGQFVGAYIFLKEELPVFLIVAVGLYAMNFMVMRFADEQSLYMAIFTVTIGYTLQADTIWLLPSFWLTISPLPLLNGFDLYKNCLDVVPVVKPFDLKPYKDAMHEFFAEVQKDERVFLAFDDPGTVYENIYSGYRQLIELPSYVANEKEFLLFPEWWGVFELNYEDAPEIWGRDIAAVKTNTKHWGASYVMIYQDSGSELDPKWEADGFEALGSFDWETYRKDFSFHKRYHDLSFKWFLLRVPSEG